jgi:membrane associated rhomboid family serine protease/ribosomal protein L40E
VESSSPELSVVCRNCGAEVSPYVTECPYCGTRLRKRAPKLERQGDQFTLRESLRDRRRRRAAERRRAGPRFSLATDRPVATIAAIAAPCVVLIVERAADLSPFELGAIFGPIGGDWWRYLAAPWVYDDLGYLFAIGLALAIFLPAVERRVGLVSAVLLVILCGSVGALAAVGMESAVGDGIPVAAGGNGIALGVLGAWLVLRDAEHRRDPTAEYDQIAVAVAAAVLLLLPLVEDFASAWAGLAGGLVGLACGLAAALGQRSTQ